MIREVTYDAEANAAYIYLSDDYPDVQVEIDDGTNVDLGMSGYPIGIEVLDPYRSWPLDEIFTQFPELKADRTALEGLHQRTHWVDTYVRT